MAKPVKITRRSLAAQAADRWLEAYGEDGGVYGEDKVEVLRELRALGDHPRASDVDRVIGNNSWTQVPACDGCGREKNATIVQVGADMDYSSCTARLCVSCLRSAYLLAFPKGATP